MNTLDRFAQLSTQQREQQWKIEACAKALSKPIKQQIEQQGYYTLSNGSFFERDQLISANMHLNIPMALAPHKHDFFELIYVYQGSVINVVDAHEVVLQQGDLCIMNASAIHTLGKLGKQDTVYNILIKPELFNQAFLGLIAENEIISSFFLNSIYQKSISRNFMTFHTQDFPSDDAETYVHRLIMENHFKDIYYNKSIEISLVGLFIELTRGYKHRQDQNSSIELGMSNVSQIIAYISDHYKDISIKQVADHFSYHPNYLSSLLKKYTDKTFSEILQNIRFTAAKEYLQKLDIPINEIVYMVGYTNKSHFYRTFKQEMGITPAQYRKQAVASKGMDSLKR